MLNFTPVKRAFACLWALALLLPTQSAQADQETYLTLYGRAEAFRQMAVQNPYDALLVYATQDGVTAMDDVAQTLFPQEDLGTGYADFFAHALPIPMPTTGDTHTVGFLHPWSDTLLLSLWQDTTDGFKLSDAAMAPTAIFRGEDAPYPSAPGWRADPDLIAQEAIGLYTAFTTDGLQIVFADGGQEVFQNLDPDLRDAFAFGAALSFMEYRGDLLPLHRASQGPAAEVRAIYDTVLLPALSGHTPTKGHPEHIASQLAAISALAPQIRTSFVPVVYGASNGKSVLILCSVANPDVFIAMRAEHANGTATLQEIALLGFQPFADLYASLGDN